MNLRDLVFTLRSAGATDRTGLLVVITVAILVVAVALGILMYWLYSRTPRGKLDALLDERAESRAESRWPWRIATVALLVLGVALAARTMDSPSTCAECHQDPDYAESVSQTAHSTVTCLECHGGTGITGGLRTTAAYARWMYVYASTKQPPDPAGGSATDGACLRCHAGVRIAVVTSGGIRVRHKDFLDAGAHCRDCHSDLAHGDDVKDPTNPGMEDCVPCHDGKQADAECETCHVEDELEVASRTVKLPKVRNIDTSDCYACHDERPCLRCHGVTMPHPAGWGPNSGGPGLSGSHARQGFTDRELCWRCHFSNERPFERPATRGGFTQTPDGCTCHGSFGNMHGGAAWVAEHGLQATGQKAGSEAECYSCHDARYLCDQCHDEDVKRRYNPKPGPDSYRRDIPKPPGYWEY